MTEVLSHCAGADVHRHVKALNGVKRREQTIKNSNEREKRTQGIKSNEARVRVVDCAIGVSVMMNPCSGICRKSVEYVEVNIGVILCCRRLLLYPRHSPMTHHRGYAQLQFNPLYSNSLALLSAESCAFRGTKASSRYIIGKKS
jgi:hypothetical protein